MMKVSSVLAVATLLIGLSVFASAASVVTGQVPPQKTPPTRPPTIEYERRGAEIAAKNEAFLNKFVASGASARSLRRMNFSSYDRGPATLSAASQAAVGVVVGRVTATSFSPNGAGLPIATSTITVDRVVVGSAGQTIQVTQLGGPMESDRGPVLAQLEVDEVLLPGDSVVLFLVTGPSGTNRLLPGAGAYAVTGGRVSARQGNPFSASVNGLELDHFLNLVTSAR